MAESSIAGERFEHVVEYALAVCKECRHGVLPSQIKSHVQRSHHVKRKEAELIADEVRSWAGLILFEACKRSGYACRAIRACSKAS